MDISSLYELQDKVLDAVFAGQTDFYLTGGTCLHRFYEAKRHSDDLDLFTAETNIYREDAREVLTRIREAHLDFSTRVDTRDFIRLVVADALQVDLVNDRVFRHGRSISTERGYKIDNLENICANKICAILGRDEPKDMFDICTILLNRESELTTILEAAKRKCLIDSEQLEYRLRAFPRDALGQLAIQDDSFLEVVQSRLVDVDHSEMDENVRRIILFGSVQTGTVRTEKFDIDLVVEGGDVIKLSGACRRSVREIF